MKYQFAQQQLSNLEYTELIGKTFSQTVKIAVLGPEDFAIKDQARIFEDNVTPLQSADLEVLHSHIGVVYDKTHFKIFKNVYGECTEKRPLGELLDAISHAANVHIELDKEGLLEYLAKTEK